METNLSFKYLISLQNINHNFNTEQILKLQLYKTYMVFQTYSNSIISFNQSTEKYLDKKFKTHIFAFTLNENRTIPLIFVLLGTTMEVFSFFDFLPVKSYSFSYCVFDFSLFENYNNFNLELILSNEMNEIVYYNKGLLMENTKVLSKEKEKVTKIKYKEPFLIWVVNNTTIKVFDLEKKILIYRNSFENEIKMVLKDSSKEREMSNNGIESSHVNAINVTNTINASINNFTENKINFDLQDRYLIINICNKFIHIIKILEYNFTNYQTKKFFYEEVFKINLINGCVFNDMNSRISQNTNEKLIFNRETQMTSDLNRDLISGDYNNKNINKITNNITSSQNDLEQIYIGCWLNVNKDKIFLIKNNIIKNNFSNSTATSIPRTTINTDSKSKNKNYFIEIEVHSFRERLIKLKFDDVYFHNPTNIKLDFDPSSFNIVIYDEYDVHSLYLIDPKTKLLNQIKLLNRVKRKNRIKLTNSDSNISNTLHEPSYTTNNDNNITHTDNVKSNDKTYELIFKKKVNSFKQVLDSFADFKSFDEKKFIILSLFNHLRLFIQKSNSKKIEKLLTDYIISSINYSKNDSNSTNSNNANNNTCSNTGTLVCNFIVEYLIKENQLEFCFNYLNRFLNYLSDKMKEKVFIYFVSLKNFDYLETFINVVKDFKLNIDDKESDINNYLIDNQFIHFIKVNIDNLVGIDKLRLISCYTNLCILTKNYNEAIKYNILYGEVELSIKEKDDRNHDNTNSLENKKNSSIFNSNIKMISNTSIKRIFCLLENENLEEYLFNSEYSNILYENMSFSQLSNILRNIISKIAFETQKNSVSKNKDNNINILIKYINSKENLLILEEYKPFIQHYIITDLSANKEMNKENKSDTINDIYHRVIALFFILLYKHSGNVIKQEQLISQFIFDINFYKKTFINKNEGNINSTCSSKDLNFNYTINVIFSILFKLKRESMIIKFLNFIINYNKEYYSSLKKAENKDNNNRNSTITNSNTNIHTSNEMIVEEDCDINGLNNLNFTTAVLDNNENSKTNSNLLDKMIDYNVFLLENSVENNDFLNLKIFVYTKLNKIEQALDLIVTSHHNIEKAVYYIEDLELSQSTKQEYYSYLQNLIKNETNISNIEKYYYISLFKEQVSIIK